MKKRITIIYLVACCVFLPSSVESRKLADKAKVYLKEELSDQVGATSKLKKGVKSLLHSLPGGGFIAAMIDELDGGGLEEKVDRIDKRQKTSLDRLREIAQEALATKKKVESMYYFKKKSQEEAAFLAQGLRRGSRKKFLGAMLEAGLKIPINPAEYIPATPQTKQLKQNIDFDLSFEQGYIKQSKFLLSNTRAAIIASDLMHTHSSKFDQAYAKAEQYEVSLKAALRAKQIATVKIYRAEIERLEKEIKLLEGAKSKQGLTVGDVVQLEMAIDSKRKAVRELHEKIDARMEADLNLSEADKFKMAVYKANKESAELVSFIDQDKQRIKATYSHLWKF
jgi:hypothetical protein